MVKVKKEYIVSKGLYLDLRHRQDYNKKCTGTGKGLSYDDSIKLEERQMKIELQIQKNVRIIDTTNRRGKNRRKLMAIYRLYRYCNLTPAEISYETGIQKPSIKIDIGKVFAELCQKDKKCAFKELLGRK